MVGSHVLEVTAGVDLSGADDVTDPNHICDLFSVQTDTVQYDAARFYIDDPVFPDDVSEELTEEYKTLFEGDTLQEMARNSNLSPCGKHRVFTRKPRVRIFLVQNDPL